MRGYWLLSSFDLRYEVVGNGGERMKNDRRGGGGGEMRGMLEPKEVSRPNI